MIIDFHTHIFPPAFIENRARLVQEDPGFKTIYSGPQARLASAEDLIRNMDETGVDRSVVFGFPWEKAELFARHNDYILESIHRYPDRLTGFCAFHPMSPKGAEEAERCLHEGLSGVGELAAYGSSLSKEVREGLREVMEVSLRADAPLLLHTNEPVGHTYPGKTPIRIEEVYAFVRAYADNRIVLAHWGGGLFFFGLLKKEVKEAFRNVWFDTAASPFLYSPQVYRIAAEIVGPEKIVFGSDYPLISPRRYFKEMATADLPPLQAEQIKGQNAARILKV